MSTQSYTILIVNTKKQAAASSGLDILFNSLAVGLLASNLIISETSGAFSFNSKQLRNVADPTSAQDVATKAYADAIAAGFDPKDSVDYATTAALAANTYNNGTAGVGATLTANANGALSVDGVAVSVSDRILVKNEATGSHNGIYTVTATGDGSNPYVLTRSTDFDNNPGGEVSKGARTLVDSGNTLTGFTYFLATTGSITIGTTALNFSLSDSTPTATSGSGGAIQGKVTADSDLGLSISAGVMSVKKDNSTITFNGSGQLQVPTNGITATQIASDAVTTVKILDQNVTTAKIVDLGVTTVKLAATSVTAAKLGSDVAGAGLTGGNGSALAVDYTNGSTMTNDNAGTISAGQVVYLKTNGHVDLARADTSNLDAGALGLVQDATIATTAAGKIALKQGDIVGGFSSLTVGATCYVSRVTAGAVTQSLSGFVSGEYVYQVGRAISATQILFDPEFQFQYA